MSRKERGEDTSPYLPDYEGPCELCGGAPKLTERDRRFIAVGVQLAITTPVFEKLTEDELGEVLEPMCDALKGAPAGFCHHQVAR